MLYDLKLSYIGVGNILSRYWKAYGGWRALLLSPYLHASIVLTILLAHNWMNGGWWEDPISVLPAMVGFGIGSYALVLGFGDERFRSIIMTRIDGETSPYVTISASLAHFIVVQLFALSIAILAKGFDFPLSRIEGFGTTIDYLGNCIDWILKWGIPIGYFLGYLLYVYAITTALATAMAIFR